MFNNNSDFENIGAEFTGPEVFILVRLAIDAQIKNAEAEVARLTRIVQRNAAALSTQVDPGIPGDRCGQATEDQVTLQSARAQLAATKTMWLAALSGVAGPSITSKTQESLDSHREEFRAEARAKLDAWYRADVVSESVSVSRNSPERRIDIRDIRYDPRLKLVLAKGYRDGKLLCQGTIGFCAEIVESFTPTPLPDATI